MHTTTLDVRPPIRVRLIYRDPLLHAGLRTTLACEPRFCVSVADDDDRDAVCSHDADLRRAHPRYDVIVTDYETGLSLVQCPALTPACRGARVMVVTWRSGEDEIREALAHGVRGYLLTCCPVVELIDGIAALHLGHRHLGAQIAQRLAESVVHDSLTAREVDVMRLVAQGLSNKSVALELDIAVATVKAHVKSIFSKLGAASRTEALALARRRGLLNLAIRSETRSPRPLREPATADLHAPR